MEQLLLIALATFVTEDLTCIATGALVAQGKLDFLPGTMACLLGIYAGDLLLFLGGRFARWPVLRFVPEEKIKRASDWISRRGLIVVFLSRFAPGLRLPTYVAAGLLKTPFRRFALYFLAAAAIWTPLLVGAAALLGAQLPRAAFVPTAAIALAVGAILRFRVRRRVVGFVRRKLRWEFWPAWAAYIPVIPYLLYLALKHRSLTLFTAVNPGMPSSGFAGESKSEILEHLSASGAVARYALIPGSIGDYARIERAAEFLDPRGFPVVLKPDVGERGSGVAIVRSRGELESYLRAAQGDTIIQEYIAGLEFGVFYYRDPREPEGRIFSITEKRFPDVAGDGESTLEQLILRDPRAVCLASVYLRASKRPATYVPTAGESTQLAELVLLC
jgi:membrane protein DedA with SNARE-associated domain